MLGKILKELNDLKPWGFIDKMVKLKSIIMEKTKENS